LGFTLAGSKRLQGMSSLATDLGLCGIFFFFFFYSTASVFIRDTDSSDTRIKKTNQNKNNIG